MAVLKQVTIVCSQSVVTSDVFSTQGFRQVQQLMFTLTAADADMNASHYLPKWYRNRALLIT